jgi:beta-N-acetylhexosaminidase
MTPADTSASVAPGLAQAIRARHPHVDEVVTSSSPTHAEISGLRQRAGDYQLVVVGTINAWFDSGQPDLVDALLASGVPVVTVALRVPFDLARYPAAPTHVCTYSILSPSLDALVRALWGDVPFQGRLPASIPGQYPTGHALEA